MPETVKRTVTRDSGAECRLLLTIAHKILAQTFMGDCPLYVTPSEQGNFSVRSFGHVRRRVRLDVARDPQYGWMFREAKVCGTMQNR